MQVCDGMSSVVLTVGPDHTLRDAARQMARRGVGAAIRTGIQAAREKGHWAVVVMAANGKDDPAEAPRLIEALESGYDYVQGSRYLASGGASINLPLGRSIMIRGYTLLFRLLSGFRVSDVTNGFRAYRLDLFDDPRIRIDQSWLDRYELEYYIHWKVVTLGYRVIVCDARPVFATPARFPFTRKYPEVVCSSAMLGPLGP